MTHVLRIDIVSLFDLDFKGKGVPPSSLAALTCTPHEAHLSDIYAESFGWVFYGSSLPGFQRFNLPPPAGIQNGRGVSVLVNPEYGVGVYSVWQTFDGSVTPLDVKWKSWESVETSLEVLKKLDLSIEDIERHYPFIGIQVSTSDVVGYCTEHAEELGRIFTGNYEREDKAQLEAYIRENLSHREYERLFLRWTEGLGVYGSNIDESMYEQTLFRAVQIFETCIVVRRLLRNITKNVDNLSSRLSVVTPKPWAVNRLLYAFLQIQRMLVSGPPVQSVEGERLLRTAYRSFGIDAIVENTRQSCDFLERRFQ